MPLRWLQRPSYPRVGVDDDQTAAPSPGASDPQGAVATASSTEWSLTGRLRPGSAIDDDRSTRWASRWGDDAWWSVDLGTPRLVRTVTLDWERAHARDYRLQVSLDGAAWRTASTVRGSDGGLDHLTVPATSARHVRVVTDERATQYGISLREVQIGS